MPAVVSRLGSNHDLWTKGRLTGGVHVRPKPIHSLERLEEIFGLCAQLGVLTRPAYACGAIVCPILSWYHESWDTEPDIKGWKGIPPHTLVMSDFHACTWPPHLSNQTDSIAAHFDALNDKSAPLAELVSALQADHPNAPLITCSHFVPHVELNPEKRFLFFPPLAKACGSSFLAKRIAALGPHVHCFGHTHFGWDATLADGIRYVQAPLSYPEERQSRLGSVATGEDFPHGDPPTPLLVYDAPRRAFPPRYDAGWSNFYARYPRRADLCHILAPYVAAQGYEQVAGVGEVGWFGNHEVDPFTGEPMEEPLPAWRLGPSSAVSFERSQRRANPSVYAAMGGEAGRSPSGSPTGSPRLRATGHGAPASPNSVPRSPSSFRPSHEEPDGAGSATARPSPLSRSSLETQPR